MLYTSINAQDDRLREAVERYGERDWVAVAIHMGQGITRERCLHRWKYYVRPELKSRKVGPWDEEEVRTDLTAFEVRNQSMIILPTIMITMIVCLYILMIR